MPQPKTNLNSYREEIIQLYQNDIFKNDIVSYLQTNYNIQVDFNTVKHHLKVWSVFKQIQTDDSSQL